MSDPLVAVMPGVWDPWVRVDTHAVGRVHGGEVLAIHLTRYAIPDDSGNDCAPPDTLTLHTLGTAPLPFRVLERRMARVTNPDYQLRMRRENDLQERRAANESSVIIGRAFDSDPPELVLDAMMRRYIAAHTIGIRIDDRTCLVAMRTRQLLGVRSPVDDDAGFVVVMRGEEGAPAPLFPSALEGWAIWWRSKASELLERPVASAQLPQPPPDLDVVEGRKSYRIRVDGCKPARWPRLPEIPRADLGDDYL
ncbi:hypothetical protein [Streptomyces sp. NPDC023838]|uniref:hypothetical protein n=1 Tax=Streptomyces sp. NPDC023838 TaxID=3154325 RepID=UPI0033D2A664